MRSLYPDPKKESQLTFMNPKSDPFFDDLESVTYGCHATSREMVKRVFEDAENFTFSFAEYFLDEPVTKETATNGELSKRKIYFPFLPWAASTLLFRVETPKSSTESLEDITTKFSAKTGAYKRDLRTSCGTGTSLEKWNSQLKRIPEYFKSAKDKAGSISRTDTVKGILERHKEGVALGKPSDPLNEGLESYNIQLHLWSQADISESEPVVVIRVPIATDHSYYGHLLVVYQEQEMDHKKRKNDPTKLCNRLEKLLKMLAKDRYTPTLTLLHVSKWERMLAKFCPGPRFLNDTKIKTPHTVAHKDARSYWSYTLGIEIGPNKDWSVKLFDKNEVVLEINTNEALLSDGNPIPAEDLRKTIRRNPKAILEWFEPIFQNYYHEKRGENFFGVNPKSISPLSLKWGRSQDPVERAFGSLWKNREKKWKEAEDDKSKQKDTARLIKASIILDKYHIASPAMVKQVHEVVRGAAAMKATGSNADSLPSALVFGEAGSGKDKMARLIPTLTKEFWAVEPSTHNMAAVKPSILAIPLMFGVEFNTSLTALPGLFRRKPENGEKEKDPEPQVIILDELNSLDYDMQGSLLRLLENNEVSPLFGKEKPEPINALVVGIVNEDPERVTREQELDLLDGARDFLGQAESARLYESLHKARRLRPDLVYRLKRGVYVRMPSLRERREDIPLLFSHPCKETIKSSAKRESYEKIVIQIDLEAFDELMRPEISWPGNIRQLQAAATKIGNIAWERWKRNGANAEKGLDVSRRDVRKGLKEFFPKVYEHDLEDDLKSE